MDRFAIPAAGRLTSTRSLPQLRLGLSVFLFALSAPTMADKADLRAKPRFELYPGAFVINTNIVEYNTLMLHTKLEQGEPDMIQVTGDSRQISYRVKNVSTEKVFRNYEQALQKAGFTVKYQCAADQCGKHATRVAAARSAFREVPPVDRHTYYLVAQKVEAGLPVTFAVMVSTNNIGENAHVVTTYIEETPLEKDLVVATKDYRPMQETRTITPKQVYKDDHPLLPRYPGSLDSALTKTDYGSLELPDASKDSAPKNDALRGQLHQAIYMARDVSAEKVYLNYKSALEQAGFTISTLCKPDGCPVRTDLQEIATRLFPGQKPRGHHGYYLKGVKGTVHLGLLVTDAERKGTVFIRQAIMEVEDLETGLIEISSDEIAQQVRHTGKALIYGIYFDTGKAEIKTESKSTLDAIHEFLKANPDMHFYVVGHTDDTGNLESNLTLSRNRAAAVVKALVDSYGVSRQRLSPQGVGAFAPAAANQTDSGRTQNRRVELVWRLSH